MNYYEVLEITPNASEEVIKAAYKALVKKYHPDNGNVNGTEKLQLINEAYKTLSDATLRKQYDKTLVHADEQPVYTKTEEAKERNVTEPKPKPPVRYSNSYESMEEDDNDTESGFVVNLVMMTDRVKLQELTSYLQIFNRTSADVCDVLESDKKIQNIVQSAKDETILFVGVQDETISPYKRQKIINNFASITKNALGKGCVTFDEGKSIRGIVVCMAGHTIMQREVSHIFIDDDFFDKYEEPLGKESMEAVWATFINYVEGRYEEVEKILRNNSLGASLKEKYWRAILALVKDFWKAVGTSWNDVLNLSKDFSFDFLWNEETYDFEDASEAIVKIVRQEMGKISVIPKEKAQGGEEFVYDDNYLWIAPGLFTRWIQKSRLDAGKAELLIKCREEGLLLPGEYGGYTSRLQRGHIRKEYYRFVREKFTGVGQVEIIDLAGGK